MPEPLKVGIVGCGRIGFLLEDDPLRAHPCTHAGAFSAVPNTMIVAACDIDEERLHELGRRYGVGRLSTSCKRMLCSERLDLLCISSWTSTHVAIGVEACRSGVRGILCEKPIATDIRSGRRLVEECRARGEVARMSSPPIGGSRAAPQNERRLEEGENRCGLRA